MCLFNLSFSVFSSQHHELQMFVKSYSEYDISNKYKYKYNYTLMSGLYSNFATSNNRSCEKNRY